MKRQKKDVWKFNKEENRKVKKCIYHIKKKVNEQFEKKMNQDMNGNRKLFWKEVSCSKIRDGKGGWHKERMKCKGF